MEGLRHLYANRWARYGLTALLLGLVTLRIHPAHLASAAGSVDPRRLLLALALTPPFIALKVARWHAMLVRSHVDASVRESALSLVAGMGLALLTPARLGELVRVAYLRDPQKWKIGGLVMIDKGFDVLVLACMSIPGAWALLGPGVGAVFVVVAVLGLFVVYEPRPLWRTLTATLSRLPLASRLNNAVESLDALTPPSTTLFLLLTTLSFLLVLVQFGLILSSWHRAALDVVLLTFPLVILTNVLPLTIGGLGLREGVAAVLLAHYGVAPANAALAAFLMFAINTALPGMVGAALLPARPAAPGSRPVGTLDHT